MKRTLLLLCAAGLGCGPGRAAPRPPAPIACGAVGELAAPLVIDWSDGDRAALAAAIPRGVVAVAYQCGALRIVPECTAPERYRFAAITPARELVHLDADDLAANVPGHGAAWARADGSAGVDAALVTAGRWSTIKRRFDRADLEGKCDGVTHVVRAIDLGASAWRPAGGTGDAAALFARADRRDPRGTPSACASVDPAASAPPPGCDAAVRLQMVALGSDAGDEAAVVPAVPCGADRVWQDGTCARPSPAVAHQCRFGDLADCRAQCERKHAGSCTMLALMLAGATDATRDEHRGAALLQEACAAGEPLACRHTADILASGELVPRDEARAIALFTTACDAGIASACTYLGAMVQAGRGQPADPARAGTWFRRACAAGDRRGCELLGATWLAGTPDYAKAEALFGEACTAGDIDACNSLAGTLTMSSHAAPDLRRAAALLERACVAPDPNACANLGVLLIDGVGTAKDEARGTRLLREACAAGIENGCVLFASHQLDVGAAEGRIDDSLATAQAACVRGHAGSCAALARMRDGFEAGCDRGEALACANAGQLVVSGIGGAADDVHGRTLLGRGCDGTIPVGCTGLAVMLLEGRGGPADPQKGLALLRANCTAKEARGCTSLGSALAQGLGTKADLRAALAAFEIGCTSGNAESCEDAGVLLYDGKDVGRDATKASARIARGCELGRASSCSKQGALLIKDGGDRARGIELLRDGCARGDDWGCDQLKLLGVAPPRAGGAGQSP